MIYLFDWFNLKDQKRLQFTCFCMHTLTWIFVLSNAWTNDDAHSSIGLSELGEVIGLEIKHLSLIFCRQLFSCRFVSARLARRIVRISQTAFTQKAWIVHRIFWVSHNPSAQVAHKQTIRCLIKIARNKWKT